MRIRLATESDLDAIGRIFEASSSWLVARYRPELVGHPFALRDTFNRHLLRTGRIFLAEDPAPVGFSAAIVRDGVWFLSQLWVDPDQHGAGAGSALLREALDWGAGAEARSVVASPYPVAQRVYLRAAMFPLWDLIDMTGQVPPEDAPDGVDELRPEDQAWVDELEREMRGGRRPEDHAFFREMARGLALRGEGGPAGFVYVWPDGKIGPAAWREPADMPLLMRAARSMLPEDGRVTLAIPSTNWSVLREAVGLGLSPTGSNLFMATRPLGDPTRYIASGGGLG